MSKINLIIGFAFFFYGLDNLSSDLTSTFGWILTIVGFCWLLVFLARSKTNSSGALMSSKDTNSNDSGGGDAGGE